MTTIRFTEIDAIDVEWTIEVVGEYQPYRYGSRDSYGAPYEPDEPDHFEIISITVLEMNQDFDESELSEFLSISEHELCNTIQEKLFEAFEADKSDYFDNFINDFD